MVTEGAFNHSNGSLIDEHISADRVPAIITHEGVHYELGATTTYGQLLMMLHKNSGFDNRSKSLYGELFSHIYKMQERSAVNVELLSNYIKDDENSYRTSIQLLKERNRTYYNYFRKLCCINGQVASKSDAEVAVSVIRSIAKWAMNVDLDNIPFEKFLTPKDLQRFFSIGDNSCKFNPNKRFDIIVDSLFRSGSNPTDLVLVLQGSVKLDTMTNIGAIHKIAERAAISILESSPIKERLIQRIRTIGVQQIEIDHEHAKSLTILPVDLNSRHTTPEFIMLDFDSFLMKLNKQRNREIIVPNLLGGFEDVYFCTIVDENTPSIIYCLTIDNEFKFLEALQKLNCRTIFTKTKIVSRLHKSLKQVIGKLPIFIYYDSPIINALDFIKCFYPGGKYYFHEKNGYYLLVIHKRSFYSIFSVVLDAKKLLETTLTEYNITPSSRHDCLDHVERINNSMRSNFQIS